MASSEWRRLCELFEWQGDTPADLAGMACDEIERLRSELARSRRTVAKLRRCVLAWSAWRLPDDGDWDTLERRVRDQSHDDDGGEK